MRLWEKLKSGTMAHPLKKILQTQGHGANRRLARSIGAFDADVANWANGARQVPAHYAVAIERETGGQVTVEELRSDLSWVRVQEDGWPDGKPVLDVERDGRPLNN